MSNRAIPLFLMLGSPMQLLVIALILILLFGAGRLAEVGKGLGEGIKNFKKGIGGDDPKPNSRPPEVPRAVPAEATVSQQRPSQETPSQENAGSATVVSEATNSASTTRDES
jgi:sec-independent protein translocase protein TatA